jgi:hypothetical protein
MNMRLLISKIRALDAMVAVSVVIAVGVGIVFSVWLVRGTTITVQNDRTGERIGPVVGPLSGLPCPDPAKRPFAVMLASDPEARPVSGLGSADLVFEMPVTPNGITRMMAVFQCNWPEELGSIRSARMDFIPLVQGLGAVYAHWGGEQEALTLLDGGIVDNIDALKFEGTTYYRKDGIPAPHDGFTTPDLLWERTDALGYAASASVPAFLWSSEAPERNLAALVARVAVSWPQGMDVEFRYDADRDEYLRWRDGEPEIDATTDRQVAAGVVIVMTSEVTGVRDQYLGIRTTGTGAASVYQHGRLLEARWRKSTVTDMLSFTDQSGEPLPLAHGPVWILIDAPLP